MSAVDKKSRISTPLEQCLSQETSEALLDHLLKIEAADMKQLAVSLPHTLSSLREMWRGYVAEEEVCAVLGRVFLSAVLAGEGEEVEGEEEGVREFALAIARHGRLENDCKLISWVISVCVVLY